MAVTVLGTVTPQSFTAASTTGYTNTTHTCTAGTGTLLFIWFTRCALATETPTFAATWNGVALTQLDTNYTAGSALNTSVYWAAILHAPDSGAHDLVMTTGGINQVGGSMAIINLAGVDTTDPLGANQNQKTAPTTTTTVSLTAIPATTNNFVICGYSISTGTTVDSVNGIGSYSIVGTDGVTTVGGAWTRTIRYQLNVTGSTVTGATFGASLVRIGGFFLELRSASTTTTDKTGDVDIAMTISAAQTAASIATRPDAAALDGQSTFTTSLIVQADDTGITRNMVRIGSPTSTRFTMKRSATGIAPLSTDVAHCEWVLTDGTAIVESFSGALSTELSVITCAQTPANGVNINVDASSQGFTTRTGGALTGPLAIGPVPIEIGGNGDTSLLAYSGLISRWIVDGLFWTTRQRQLFTKAVMTPELLFGWGTKDTILDTTKSPIALPIVVTLTGAAFLNINPNAIDPDGTAPTLIAVSDPPNGTAEIISGVMRYTPTTGYLGVDTFTYTVSDSVKTSIGHVHVTVSAGVLTAVLDAFNVSQTGTATIDPRSNDTGGAGPKTILSITQPANGVATLNEDFTVTYDPVNTHTGTDDFTYLLTDGISTTTGTIRPTVQADAVASASADSATTLKGQAVTIFVLNNDGPTGIRVDVAEIASNPPLHGTVEKTADNLKIIYTPDTGYTGADDFTYRCILPSNSTTDTAVVTVQVNDPPPASSNRSGLPWRSGVRLGGASDAKMNAAGAKTVPPGNEVSFRAFRGRQVDLTFLYSGGTAWGKGNNNKPAAERKTADEQWEIFDNNSNLNPGGLLNDYMGQGYDVIYAHAMQVEQDSGKFANIADGTRDTHHVGFATRLAGWLNTKPADYPIVLLGFGQENTGAGYPWAIQSIPGYGGFTDAQHQAAAEIYKRAYKRICRIFDDKCNTGTRTRALGNPRVKFSFNCMYNWRQAHLEYYYPGHALSGPYNGEGGANLQNYDPIDCISMDCYDNGSNGSPFANATAFNTWLGTTTFNAIPANLPANSRGPKNVAAWARHYGKAFGIQEWATGADHNNVGGNFGPPTKDMNYEWYIKGMWDWFNEMATETENGTYNWDLFECFFNETTDSKYHNIWKRTVGGQESAQGGQILRVSDEYVRLWTP